MEHLLYIDGHTLPKEPMPPYAFGKKELDVDSGRNLDGVMERTILAHHPHTLTLTFPPMTQSEMQQLLQRIDHSYLSVLAFDPFIGDYAAYMMYHGDLTPEMYLCTADDGRILYQAFTVDLIEY